MTEEQRPFWKEDPGDLPPDDAADPPAGDDAGEWVDVPHVSATVFDQETGHKLGTVLTPFDPDNPPSDADLERDVLAFSDELDHMRSIVKQEAVLDVARAIEEAGPGARIIKKVADAMRGAIRVDAKSDGDASPEAIETARQAIEQPLRDNLELIIAELASTGETPGEFWQDYARDTLAHALVWAQEATIEELGKEHAASLPEADFETAVLERYRTGEYTRSAMITLYPGRVELLGERFAMFVRFLNESSGRGELLENLLRKARANNAAMRIAGRAATINVDTTPAPSTNRTLSRHDRPAFDPHGYGNAPNHLVATTGRRGLSASQDRWPLDETGRVFFERTNKHGAVRITPSLDLFPTPDAAAKEVAKYSPLHVVLFQYIMTKYMANRANLGPYGGFYLSVDEFLDVRGLAQHKKGGHKGNPKKDVIEALSDLRHIDVYGHHEDVKGKETGRKGSRIAIKADLIEVSHTIVQSSFDGEETPVAWYLRPGDWAATLDSLTKYHALTAQSLMQLHAHDDRYTMLIGFFLLEDFRIRSEEANWRQPYRVAALLDGAEISIDKKNPARARDGIEAALDNLANPHYMNGAPIIKCARYLDPTPRTGRWLKTWLKNDRIEITPADQFLEHYREMQKTARSRRGRPARKLAGSTAAS